MTRHHPKEPRSVFSERFGIEELDEPVATEEFRAQLSRIALNILVLDVVYHVACLGLQPGASGG